MGGSSGIATASGIGSVGGITERLSFAGRSQTGATVLALLGVSGGGQGSGTGAGALGRDWTMLCTEANPF